VETLLRILKAAAWLFANVVLGLLAWRLALLAPTVTRAVVGGSPPTGGDSIPTILTFVTIELGVLAIMVGLLAIWGYHTIKGEAKSMAKNAAMSYLEGRLGQSQITKLVEKAVTRELSRTLGAQQLPGAFTESSAASPQIGGTNKVGKVYPKK
jgi:hypothetical protein